MQQEYSYLRKTHTHTRKQINTNKWILRGSNQIEPLLLSQPPVFPLKPNSPLSLSLSIYPHCDVTYFGQTAVSTVSRNHMYTGTNTLYNSHVCFTDFHTRSHITPMTACSGAPVAGRKACRLVANCTIARRRGRRFSSSSSAKVVADAEVATIACFPLLLLLVVVVVVFLSVAS